MRGKVHGRSHFVFPLWITPAYAGKSFRKTTIRHAIKDHPRLCGEKPAKISVDGYITGSPPPMRGKAFLVRHSLLHMRITPAYAGKSASESILGVF